MLSRWLHRDCVVREEQKQREELYKKMLLGSIDRTDKDRALILEHRDEIKNLNEEIATLKHKYAKCTCSLDGESDAE